MRNRQVYQAQIRMAAAFLFGSYITILGTMYLVHIMI